METPIKKKKKKKKRRRRQVEAKKKKKEKDNKRKKKKKKKKKRRRTQIGAPLGAPRGPLGVVNHTISHFDSRPFVYQVHTGERR